MNEETKDKLALLFPKKREEIREGDLCGMRFENLDLSRLDFSDVLFREAVFDHCILSQSTFARCYFGKAEIKNCVMEQAIITDSDFDDAEISKSKLDHSFMIRCNLGMDCCFYKSSFIRVNFTGSTFKGAHRMKGSHFDDCCLDMVEGLDQEYLIEVFWKELDTMKDWNKIGWRAIDKLSKKSLLGKTKEKKGVSISIPKNEVSLDPRAGCKSGLHICRTKDLANEFGADHYVSHDLIPITFLKEDISAVHLSGDFCRVNKYMVV